jgi:exodeoxyribonuclease III
VEADQDSPTMTIDIDLFLEKVAKAIEGKKVPVVDLIAVQTKDPFKVLVATILSARTKDETTAKSAAKLFNKAPDVKGLANLSEEEIAQIIYPVGFYKNKARYLSNLPEALATFNNEVPETIEELITLPGVGRKTANLVVCVAFQKPAICVDTHVHRIMNIWEYVNTADPLKTEMALRKKLPAKHWLTVNTLLVSFGQSICRPISPHCDICSLQNDCPQKGVTPRRQHSNSSQSASTKRFISWNVNGIRAVEKKGFISILNDLDADIIGIQETKAQPDQLSDQLKNIPGYFSYWHSAERKGYSGVAVYSRQEPLKVITGLDIPEFDAEGRVLTLEFETFFFVNIYFPNSGNELKRLDYKLKFNQSLHTFCQNLSTKKSVIICGDYNVAHKEIDLKNPKNNVKNAGFTPEERAWMDSFIDSGFVDTFRMFNQDPGQYSWWSYRFNSRAKNVGWRIDYFCIDAESSAQVKDASILQEVMGSDHCPVQIEFQEK